MAEKSRAFWALQLTSWVRFAAVGNTAAVMTEEALADREYVRRGDAAGLQGVNGKQYTAVPVDGDAPKVPVFLCIDKQVSGGSVIACPARVKHSERGRAAQDHSMYSYILECGW